jgi:PTS system nitrogen regulatory IIA component
MELTVRDVAKLLNVSEKTVYRWIQGSELPAYKVHEQYRFNRAELLEWATGRKVNVSAEIFEEPDEGPASLPPFSAALEAGGVFYRVGGTDRESVLRAVVAFLRLPDAVDRDFLFRVLLAREQMGSTAVGEGIAMPHVRNPIVLHVERPSITLCFLERPIDFQALDGAPVNTLFTVISPTVRGHLHLLSRLAFALRTPEFRSAVKRQLPVEDILDAARHVDAAILNKEQSKGEPHQ